MKKKKSHDKFAIVIAMMIVFFVAMSTLNVWQADIEIENITSKQEKVSFGWWGNDERHHYTLQALDLFEKDNPDIKVSYSFGVWDGYERRNRIYMLSGTEPDVMQINYNWLNEYSFDGKGYYDINKLRNSIDLSGYRELDLSYGMMNGKLNAIPIAYNSIMCGYNVDIFKRYQMDIPKTWDDLFAAAKVMKRDGIYPMGIGKKHLFMVLMAHYEQESGKKIFNEKGEYIGDEKAMKSMLEFGKKLLDEKVIPYYDGFGVDSFSSGKCAGVMYWASDAGRYNDKLEEKGMKSVVEYPPVMNNSQLYGWYVKPATMYAIRKNIEDENAAANLLNFLINNSEMIKLQGTEKGIPINKHAREVLAKENMLEGAVAQAGFMIFKIVDKTSNMIPSMEKAEILDAFKDVSDRYFFEKENLDNSAKMMNDRFIKILEN
ncbi:ABC transporter substrate-binding protein [Butyrivibrio sp. NC3005]|uniref:ABC transporter substrate-binding protein n=1 Tax=Butyrivibrio sp. NC3005 TaxID=1280685 RepID=UPI0004058E46|nr:ABC transporter substrate-binding protein [Butyrivibrio sp. NC3005]